MDRIADRNWTRVARWGLALLVAASCGLTRAVAQEGQASPMGGLDLLGNWRETTLSLRDSGGLPADCEFIAPLTAAYNYAYNAYIVGFNAREPGTATYYAAIASDQGDGVNVMAQVGPLDGPAMWDAGPWHMAAGLPDGRLIVWLTAPREYPRQLLLASDYTPGTALQVQATPPDPPGADWPMWSLACVYEYGTNWPAVVVNYTDGNGSSRGDLDAIGLGTHMASVAYLYTGADQTAAPYLFFTYELLTGDQRKSGQYITQFAWHTPQGWVIRNTGAATGQLGYVAVDPRGTGTAILVWGDPDLPSTAELQVINDFAGNREQFSSQLSSQVSLPVYPAAHGLAAFVSARSGYPLLTVTDGTDIYLGWQSTRSASGFGYYFARLRPGDTYISGNQAYPRYPIDGVAAAAHWQTGNPRLYWVQQGSLEGSLGTLVSLSYVPSR